MSTTDDRIAEWFVKWWQYLLACWLLLGAVLLATARPDTVDWTVPSDEQLAHLRGKFTTNAVRTSLNFTTSSGAELHFDCSLLGKNRSCVLPGVTGFGSANRTGEIWYLRLNKSSVWHSNKILIKAVSDDPGIALDNRENVERERNYIATEPDYDLFVAWLAISFAVVVQMISARLKARRIKSS